MKNNLKILLSFFSIILMSSCIKDGEKLDNCPRIARIVFEWIDTQPLSQSEEISVVITSVDGSTTNITSGIEGRQIEIGEGLYMFVGYEAEDNVEINAKEGSISMLESRVEGRMMEPSLFSAGDVNFEVNNLSDTTVITIPMYQQTRPLVVEILFDDVSVPIINEYLPIKNITATLSGIVLERDINDAFISLPYEEPMQAFLAGELIYDLEEPEVALRDEMIEYIATHNLLGLDGEDHILNLHIEFENGRVEDFTFDITEDLRGFRTENIHEPWNIIITLRLDATLGVTIQDWFAGPDSWLIATPK